MQPPSAMTDQKVITAVAIDTAGEPDGPSDEICRTGVVLGFRKVDCRVGLFTELSSGGGDAIVEHFDLVHAQIANFQAEHYRAGYYIWRTR